MEVIEHSADTIGHITTWANPKAEDIGNSAVEFLHKLQGPTHLHIEGSDGSRSRAAVTLLHGNEPSGLFAIFDLLNRELKPVVDIHLFILNVDAAKQAPGFVYRMLPQHKDMNRCFKEPFGASEPEQVAKSLLEKIRSLQPECVIDIHNTSGSSPSFGVTTFMDSRHDALVSLFTHRLIVTDLRLGALMELSETMMPTVTIECGGAQDLESNIMAAEGLSRYFTLADVLSNQHGEMSLEFFHNPMRLELAAGIDIAYGEHCLLQEGVTLLPGVENYNFGFVDTSKPLGFVAGELTALLTLVDNSGRERVTDYFENREGVLYPRKKIKLFMVTGNPEIARKDCLFYLVEPD
ncbi:MAG: succinylglutamate desuccinylase/aspartoacylase family protein [Pseudohongiellaceae bacterium]